MALTERTKSIAGISSTKEYIIAYDKSKIEAQSEDILKRVLKFIVLNGGVPVNRPVETTIIFTSPMTVEELFELMVSNNEFKDIYMVLYEINSSKISNPFEKSATSLKARFLKLKDEIIDEIKGD